MEAYAALMRRLPLNDAPADEFSRDLAEAMDALDTEIEGSEVVRPSGAPLENAEVRRLDSK